MKYKILDKDGSVDYKKGYEDAMHEIFADPDFKPSVLHSKVGDVVIFRFNPDSDYSPRTYVRYFENVTQALPEGVGAILLPDSMNAENVEHVNIKPWFEKAVKECGGEIRWNDEVDTSRKEASSE